MNNLQEPMVVLKYPVKLPINPKANGITTFKTKWCLFFWLFPENNLVLEFRLFVFLLFHDLL